MEFTRSTQRLGIYSAAVVVLLEIGYAIALSVGMLALTSPDQVIGDPVFSILEILIIVAAPAMLTLTVAIHAWAPQEWKAFSLIAALFMALLAGLTCSVHFVILTLTRQPAFAQLPQLPLFMSFRWPSVVYALDILAWDIFFPLAMFFAAPVFAVGRLAAWIRVLMVISGGLAFAGLAGVVTGDMRLRNIGIIGYVPVFLVVAVLLAVLFARTVPRDA